jgi:ArsR family transcriptional regulator
MEKGNPCMSTATVPRTAARAGGVRALERKAAKVAGLLGALANERRLMILCRLVEWGEANVGTLAEAVGLSQSALSQHLAKMRQEGLVAFRRDGQTLWYRLAEPRVEELFATLHRLFCQDTTQSTRRRK